MLELVRDSEIDGQVEIDPTEFVQTIPLGGFDHSLVLSIEQSPNQKAQCSLIPKKSGRKPKGDKIKVEIVVGIQSTLDEKFTPTKRLTRRTKGSPC